MGLQAKRSLGVKELKEIKELEEACGECETLHMKLNWEMLKKRSADEINDFLYYENDRLIGYIGLYSFDSLEIEITGIVHPDYRCKGVFRELFNRARQECNVRRVKRMLLLTERSSISGTKFVTSMGSRYVFSEYQMRYTGTAVPDYPKTGISLRRAEQLDFSELRQIDTICFGDIGEQAGLDIYDTTYVAKIVDKIIGKIGVLIEGKVGYIFGFGVFPEYRGRGYGREILSLALLQLMTDKIETVQLEVATENEKALSLYQSCGFRETTVYDYYEIVLK